jgi:hypothetical protein
MMRWLSVQMTEEGERFIEGVWAIFGYGNVAGIGEGLHRTGEALPTWRGQNALADDADIVVPHIRLVHISGVDGGSGRLADALDAQRGLVDEHDRSDASGQVKSLLETGYAGPFAYECASPLVQDSRDPKAQIGASIACRRGLVDPR